MSGFTRGLHLTRTKCDDGGERIRVTVDIGDETTEAEIVNQHFEDKRDAAVCICNALLDFVISTAAELELALNVAPDGIFASKEPPT